MKAASAIWRECCRPREVVEDHSGADEVGMDTKVVLYYEDEDETEEVKIVTSIRGNSLEGRISIESPLGKALLGHKAVTVSMYR